MNKFLILFSFIFIIIACEIHLFNQYRQERVDILDKMVSFNEQDLERFAKASENSYEEIKDPNCKSFSNKDMSGFGYVCHKLNSLTVSWRGTDNLMNVVDDIKFKKDTYEGCENCEVHLGFLDLYKETKESFLEVFKNSLKSDNTDNKISRIVVTGQSRRSTCYFSSF
jgi:hypothetical protein